MTCEVKNCKEQDEIFLWVTNKKGDKIKVSLCDKHWMSHFDEALTLKNGYVIRTTYKDGKKKI